MLKKTKKQKGQRDNQIYHKNGKITKLIKLDYIAEVKCWCGNNLIINSSKSIAENVCPGCGSPYTLINEEWTQERMDAFKKLQD